MLQAGSGALRKPQAHAGQAGHYQPHHAGCTQISTRGNRTTRAKSKAQVNPIAAEFGRPRVPPCRGLDTDERTLPSPGRRRVACIVRHGVARLTEYKFRAIIPIGSRR